MIEVGTAATSNPKRSIELIMRGVPPVLDRIIFVEPGRDPIESDKFQRRKLPAAVAIILTKFRAQSGVALFRVHSSKKKGCFVRTILNAKNDSNSKSALHNLANGRFLALFLKPTGCKPDYLDVDVSLLHPENVIVHLDGTPVVEKGQLEAIAQNVASKAKLDLKQYRFEVNSGSPTVEPLRKMETSVEPTVFAAPALAEGAPSVVVVSTDGQCGKNRAPPVSVKIPVSEQSRECDGGFRLNLALRWALNRTSGIVIVQGGGFDPVFSSFVDAENLLRQAVGRSTYVRKYPPRLWFALEGGLRSGIDSDLGLLTDAPGRLNITAEQRQQIESGILKLGVMIRLDDSTGPTTAQIMNLLKAAAAADPLLVVYTTTGQAATCMRATLLRAIAPSLRLPVEVLKVHAGYDALGTGTQDDGAAWNPSLLPGQAFREYCRKLDPDGSRLTASQLKTLREGLNALGITATDDGSQPHALPHAEDLVMDFCRIGYRRAGAVRSMLGLMASHDLFRTKLPSLIRAMAAAEESWLHAVALEAAVPDFILVESWLAGLSDELRRSIPSWWVNINPPHLPSVLAALVRKAMQGEPEPMQIVKDWLPYVSANLRKTANIVIDGTVADNCFWRSDLRQISLSFLGECNPAIDIPLNEVPDALLLQSEFWQLVQRLPLTVALIEQLLRLRKEFRAVIGLCSAVEWSEVNDEHLLQRVFTNRGCVETKTRNTTIYAC